MSKPAVLSWSGGKESALSLYEIKKNPFYRLVGLLSIINIEYDRISLHGIRRTFLEKQADLLNLPLIKVFISKDATDEEYSMKMEEIMLNLKRQGIMSVIFGDVFLEDVRAYREINLSKIEIDAVFPLWGRDTRRLAEYFIEKGFHAIVTCIDTKVLNKRFLGKTFDERFLQLVPSKIDPCGENGEFHTFVFNGPIFSHPIQYKVGRTVSKGRFSFIDLLHPPAKTS